jgi:hypothetical protein
VTKSNSTNEESNTLYNAPTDSEHSATTGVPDSAPTQTRAKYAKSTPSSVEAEGTDWHSPAERRVLRAKEFAYRSIPWGIGTAIALGGAYIALFAINLNNVAQPIARFEEKLNSITQRVDIMNDEIKDLRDALLKQSK